MAGDIAPKDPFSMVGNAMSSVSNGVSDVVGLFRGNSTSSNANQHINISTTTTEDVSEEKAKAYLEKLLSGTDGLASLLSAPKGAGIYNGTTTKLLADDLLGRVVANVAALSKTVTQTQQGDINNSTSQHKKGALEWIVCTELYKQGRLPHKYYRHGFKVFANYSPTIKNGYYYWAVAAVKHLRKHPNSVRSALLQDIFTARAEYLAAEAGEKSARKTVAGYLAKHIAYWFCAILGVTVARKPIDWYSEVYNKGV